MKKQIIKVGFDLDGVLLYNPVRAVRPLIYFVKKTLLRRDIDKFYYPKNSLEKLIWKVLHHTSLWPAPGTKHLLDLVKKKKIEAYIVSARYELLREDFKKWIKIIDPKKRFAGYYFNDKNEQPQVFKERMIRKLDLDVFVEDNWDIVKKLKGRRQRTKIYWVSNVFDRLIKYPHKYFSLQGILEDIDQTL